MTEAAVAPVTERPRRGGERRSAGAAERRRMLLVALVFLAPALVLLGAILVYPVIYTIVRSFFDRSGDEFVGFQNYVTMFTTESTFTAIRNNIIWVVVAPAACTILGLVFAVLLDRIRWGTAFKLIVFMPMAISMLAAGVIFRTIFQESPQLGVVNAVVVAVQDAFGGSASYPGASARPDLGVVDEGGSLVSEDAVSAGSTQDFALVGIRQSALPDDAQDAAAPSAPGSDEIAGTVFLDVVPGGGGTPGEIDPGKSGLPGVRVDAVAGDGTVAGTATTASDGSYVIEGLGAGEYRVALPADNFAEGASGVPWLGSSLITAVIILSYIWIWAGFAMVMINSGLSAIDRSLQEAARVDGATEFQVFRKITAPLLMPVLIVVFITLIINVLKIFDLVYVIPPGASKPAANVIAVEMWTVSFGGGNNQGLGSALAVLLLVLVLPFMIINVRRFRQERER